MSYSTLLKVAILGAESKGAITMRDSRTNVRSIMNSFERRNIFYLESFMQLII
ncbi:MAG: hypothetical protein QW831_02975 [Candidatus Jordarchaeaceae archaeon]